MSKRAPQDATLRNVRAAKKRDHAHDARLAKLEQRTTLLWTEYLITRAGRLEQELHDLPEGSDTAQRDALQAALDETKAAQAEL